VFFLLQHTCPCVQHPDPHGEFPRPLPLRPFPCTTMCRPQPT
jgi:hypothetical protein